MNLGGCKVLVCEMESGECYGLSAVTKQSVQALKQRINLTIKYFDNKRFEVGSDDPNLKAYFENYINKRMERKDISWDQL